ncbi:dihydroorotate dehydrogenase [Candidatus Magnetominusculus xianensis]|uniref:Dihydroorotate dehydrogenase n=1 Tax=Candidatus Magnetominusculus xianensis TaxID=1748249 RepID=A0ABR5SIK2_9BACT|nr:dihydroorotate dehydrogenase [Candidatus Magnetominusculus xianensis]MBF0405212.1 dihydroorotate dehydrogenase [Nitrospirota bacterium]
MNLSVNIGGLKLKNPVITASGTFGYGVEYEEFLDLNQIGAITVKGLSQHPAKGNLPGRIWETPCGMLNAIGLQNIGIDAFIKEKLPELRKYDTKIIANFFGDTIEEYAEAAARLSAAEGIHALEMNISCPNKQAGWIAFGTDPALTEKVVAAARKATELPLIVKLSPNVTSIADMAKAAVDGGADALSVINTITGMAIDIETRRPRLSNIVGGLSGPAIRPIALQMVFQTFKAVKVPIIGMGGIMTGGDAIEFIIAGASAVAVGTANFVNPAASIEILKGIKDYMARHQIDDINTLTGGIIC